MNLYLIADGVACPARGDEDWDGVTSLLVLADDSDHALALARAYDNGRIQPDNATIDGRTIVCVRDSDPCT